MNFESILDNLIASAIFAFITFLVAMVFRKPRLLLENNNMYPNNVNVANLYTDININNYFRGNQSKENYKQDDDEPGAYIFIGVIVFSLLTFLFSKFKIQIIELGYITSGFGLIISILIFLSVTRQINFMALNHQNKTYLAFPLVYWFLFFLSIYCIENPIMTGEKSELIESLIVKGGIKGLIPRFWELYTNNIISSYYIIVRAIGVIALTFSLVLTIWLISSFILKWIVIVRNNGLANPIVGWFYVKFKIENPTKFAGINLIFILISFFLISGLFVGILEQFKGLALLF